jgi:hypothetical protein
MVSVTCPRCRKVTDSQAAVVATTIRARRFTGFCFDCRKIGTTNAEPYAAVPGVDYSRTRLVPQTNGRGGRLLQVVVTCPDCGVDRWVSPSIIRCRVRDGNFSPRCLNCHARRNNDQYSGRTINMHGYVCLRRKAVPTDLLAAFDLCAFTQSGYKIALEHVLVMTAHVGRRPLKHEVVHHRDGNRQNNALENLQLMTRAEHTKHHDDERRGRLHTVIGSSRSV